MNETWYLLFSHPLKWFLFQEMMVIMADIHLGDLEIYASGGSSLGIDMLEVGTLSEKVGY